MDQVLIVSGSAKGGEALAELLSGQPYDRVLIVGSGSQARRKLDEASFELILVNLPLPDEYGLELALTAAGATDAGILLFVRQELAEETAYKVEDYGVFVVPKPFSQAFFYQALHLVKAFRVRLALLKRENRQLREKLEDIKVIDRAKLTLVKYLNMTEPQAHKYIEKQAMDTRLSRRQVALGILRTYDKD